MRKLSSTITIKLDNNGKEVYKDIMRGCGSPNDIKYKLRMNANRTCEGFVNYSDNKGWVPDSIIDDWDLYFDIAQMVNCVLIYPSIGYNNAINWDVDSEIN